MVDYQKSHLERVAPSHGGEIETGERRGRFSDHVFMQKIVMGLDRNYLVAKSDHAADRDEVIQSPLALNEHTPGLRGISPQPLADRRLPSYDPLSMASFVNYQVKSDDPATVAAGAAALVQGRAYVSPSKSGWVTLYDELSETQDAYEIGRIGSDLSAHLNTVILAFVVHDDLFVYFLFDHGDLLDEYNSYPVPASPGAEEDQQVRFTGRSEILINYCPPGTLRSDLEKALMRGDTLIEGGFASTVSAEHRLFPLAAALQIDNGRVRIGFNEFERRQVATPEGKQFRRIDGKRLGRPLTLKRVPPKIPPK